MHVEESTRLDDQRIQSLVNAGNRIRLESVQCDQSKGRIKVSCRYAPFDDSAPLGQETLSWAPENGVDNDFECVSMSRKVLRASGYTGILLVTPSIACQCASEDLSRPVSMAAARRGTCI